jgi:hypothetical protein
MEPNVDKERIPPLTDEISQTTYFKPAEYFFFGAIEET